MSRHSIRYRIENGSRYGRNRRLRLHRDGLTPLELTEAYAEEQDRAGWTCLLNGDHAPHMADHRVSTLRYEEPRPFHPGRLRLLLDRIDAGEFGRVVRSAGFCRLATRPASSRNGSTSAA